VSNNRKPVVESITPTDVGKANHHIFSRYPLHFAKGRPEVLKGEMLQYLKSKDGIHRISRSGNVGHRSDNVRIQALVNIKSLHFNAGPLKQKTKNIRTNPYLNNAFTVAGVDFTKLIAIGG
jgi:hypothetical protein